MRRTTWGRRPSPPAELGPCAGVASPPSVEVVTPGRGRVIGAGLPATRALRAACAGNAIEWYDFALFGALAVVLTPIFFPSEAGSSLLLAGFAVYATAFLVRPIGAIVLGRRGDSHGRQGVLVVSLLVMAVATATVGLLPTYAEVGVAASVALVSLRVVQGLAAGGELGLAAVFLAEHAPPGRRGRSGSWHTASLALGVAAGFGVAWILTSLPSADLDAGWWRTAFLLALPLGSVGVVLRRRVDESPQFLARQRSTSPAAAPVATLRSAHRAPLRAGFVLIAAGSLSFNTYFVYLPNHLVATTDRAIGTALAAAMVGLLATAVAALCFGRLSDRVGRRPVVRGCTAALAVGSVPLLVLAEGGSTVALVLTEVLTGIAVGGALSVAMVTELFPTDLPATGVALTAGLADAAGGGRHGPAGRPGPGRRHRVRGGSRLLRGRRLGLRRGRRPPGARDR